MKEENEKLKVKLAEKEMEVKGLRLALDDEAKKQEREQKQQQQILPLMAPPPLSLPLLHSTPPPPPAQPDPTAANVSTPAVTPLQLHLLPSPPLSKKTTGGSSSASPRVPIWKRSISGANGR
jgi:hypothetical protein